jgi:hypothetical protein
LVPRSGGVARELHRQTVGSILNRALQEIVWVLGRTSVGPKGIPSFVRRGDPHRFPSFVRRGEGR